jgi:hypothetical protein
MIKRIKVEEIDRVIYESQRCEGYEILKKLKIDIEKDRKKLKKMRNNFGRFWNEITREQRELWIKISTGREDIYEEIERIMRYCDEVENDKFIKEYLKMEENEYNDDNIEYINDDKNELYNLKHNILIFWIGQRKEDKKRLIKIINEYWDNNKYEEYERGEKRYKRDEYKKEEIMSGYNK